MAENYIPSAADFDEMENNLALIAKALTDKTEVDITDWASVQRAVRMGIASERLPVGSLLLADHSVYGTMILIVVAHDHYETAEVKGGHSMTLMSLHGINIMDYDEAEAFYVAEEELPAGTYNFTLAESLLLFPAGTFQFTLPNPLSKGGHLRIYGSSTAYGFENKTVGAFSDPYQPIPDACPITKGSEGVSLGTFGVELNHVERVLYGSENYKESAIRQFLNSTADKGKVWTPQTKYDVHPGWLDSYAGFANGLDEDLLAVIGAVKVPCLASNYESPDSTVPKGQKYTLNDKFFIPSLHEMDESKYPEVNDGTTQLPFYKGASDVDRRRIFFNGGEYGYWLRASFGSTILPCIAKDGSTSVEYPVSTKDLMVVPMFNIV